ncbi:hypothetical protein ACERII_24105 [Evansella sp. AB-rgal1]|uniref:hypothetical protein n=1 Tax=Evansella sp. AB-rgal1 TaxID=3242696 RepID=UPI00359D88F6
MRIVNNLSDFVLQEFESKSELVEFVEGHQSIVINANCIDMKKFYGISIKTIDSTFIGIIGGGHGIEPSILINKMDSCSLIGIDEKVYCVDLKNFENRWIKEFDSIVYEVVKATDSTFLVICELGVVSLTYSGEKLWEHTSDVITDFELSSNILRLSTEEEEYSLLLANGNIVDK